MSYLHLQAIDQQTIPADSCGASSPGFKDRVRQNDAKAAEAEDHDHVDDAKREANEDEAKNNNATIPEAKEQDEREANDNGNDATEGDAAESKAQVKTEDEVESTATDAKKGGTSSKPATTDVERSVDVDSANGIDRADATNEAAMADARDKEAKGTPASQVVGRGGDGEDCEQDGACNAEKGTQS